MIHHPLRFAGIAAGCAVVLAHAAPAHAQTGTGSAAASDAYAISAAFSSSTMSTELPPVDEAMGSAPPPYNITNSLAAFSQTIAIPPLIPAAGVPPVAASFTATATTLKSHVASKGIELDYVSATGKSTIGTASLTITNTIPPDGTLTELYLGVTANNVVTKADYSQTFPMTPTVSGSASFGALTITGSLLNGSTVTYSGSAPPNTILYQSPVASTGQIPAVTITAHEQIIVGVISCTPTCVYTPNRINVQGLNVSLYNAMINGFLVTGTIVLGSASAQ